VERVVIQVGSGSTLLFAIRWLIRIISSTNYVGIIFGLGFRKWTHNRFYVPLKRIKLWVAYAWPRQMPASLALDHMEDRSYIRTCPTVLFSFFAQYSNTDEEFPDGLPPISQERSRSTGYQRPRQTRTRNWLLLGFLLTITLLWHFSGGNFPIIVLFPIMRMWNVTGISWVWGYWPNEFDNYIPVHRWNQALSFTGIRAQRTENVQDTTPSSLLFFASRYPWIILILQCPTRLPLHWCGPMLRSLRRARSIEVLFYLIKVGEIFYILVDRSE